MAAEEAVAEVFQDMCARKDLLSELLKSEDLNILAKKNSFVN